MRRLMSAHFLVLRRIDRQGWASTGGAERHEDGNFCVLTRQWNSEACCRQQGRPDREW